MNIGDSVAIQNQTGHTSHHCNRTGIISETLPHDQYRVLVDGSRRITLRNRRFLRPILESTRNVMDDDSVTLPRIMNKKPLNVEILHDKPTFQENEPARQENEHVEPQSLRMPSTTADTVTQPDVTQANVRRSARTKKLPSRFKDFDMS